MGDNLNLSSTECEALIDTLKSRFENHMYRHNGFEWTEIQSRLKDRPGKLWSLNEMEQTGGEPDVVGRNGQTSEYLFFDCSPESPKGRRSLCYDREALESRKKFKPENSAVEVAAEMGIDLLSEDQYRALQKLGPVDTKTSSWLKTPKEMRNLGGALFGDYRFGRVFFYHNGAESYYGARGFRGVLAV